MGENKSSTEFKFDSEKGYLVAVLIALIVVAGAIALYYIAFKPAPSGYSTIYLLDSQNQASNYPDFLVANKNSTFSVQFVVENHMAQTEQYQVQVKIAQNQLNYPINAPADSTYEKTLADGEKWQTTSTVSINQPGDYSVVFELWTLNSQNVYEFSHNFCVLNVHVASS
jgi:uncharacterized membrane protein